MRSTYALSTEQHHPAYSGPDYHSMLYNNASLTNYEPRNIARRPIFTDEETEKLPNPISTNTTASKASSFPSTMGDRIVDHINQVATSLKATQQLSSAAHLQVTLTQQKQSTTSNPAAASTSLRLPNSMIQPSSIKSKDDRSMNTNMEEKEQPTFTRSSPNILHPRVALAEEREEKKQPTVERSIQSSAKKITSCI